MIPASTQILNEIDIRLKRISIKNGFSTNVKSVKRSKRTKFTVTQIPGINYYSLDESITKEYGKETHSLPVSIEFVDSTMKEPFNDLAAKRAADIVKALNENDIGISPYLGDLVDSVDLIKITPIIDQKNLPQCGVAVDLVVKFKTNVFDHSTIL